MKKQDTIFLAYKSGVKNGPGKVVDNLLKGLDKIDSVKVLSMVSSATAKYNGTLQHPASIWPQESYNYPTHLGGRRNLMGPNLFVLPTDDSKLCASFDHFIVPSKWVLELYRQFKELDHATIDVWPVGIDTDTWMPAENKLKTPELHGLIYHKNRPQQDLELVKRLITKSGATFEVLSYGSYKEEELLAVCKKVDFCVLLTGTESQGIAYQQILSCNIPCYVFDKTWWDYDGKYKRVVATSVPYFDDSCGLLAPESVSIKHFKEEFLDKLSSFRPRDYVVKNLSLEKQANEYYSLLKKYQGE